MKMLDAAITQQRSASRTSRQQLPPRGGGNAVDGSMGAGSRGYRAAIGSRPQTPQQHPQQHQTPLKSALKGSQPNIAAAPCGMPQPTKMLSSSAAAPRGPYEDSENGSDRHYNAAAGGQQQQQQQRQQPPRPDSVASSAYNSLQRQRPLTTSSMYGQSPSRFGHTVGGGCPVFRPSATHLDKLNHNYHPDDGTYRCCNHSEVDENSPSRNQHFSVGQRPISNLSNLDDGGSVGGLSVHSVGARDMLRYRARLKAMTPSAIAVQNDLEKLREEENNAKASKLEYREKWRQSIEAQLEEKEIKKQREKDEGRMRRGQFEDQAEIERREKIQKRQEQALAIQQQKLRDERLADISKMTDLQRKKHERKIAAQARMEEEERARLTQEAKVRAQREFLQRAMHEQRQRDEEARMRKLEQKRTERQIADAAKEAEDMEKAAAKAEYRYQQEQLLAQSQAQHLRKTLRDTRMQMDEESALLKLREEDENDHKTRLMSEAEKKRSLAGHLKKQVREREAAREREKAATLSAQQRAIADAQQKERDEAAAERHIRAAKKWQLQQELEEQMSYNTQKSLVDIATE